jgi:hypothetical protein
VALVCEGDATSPTGDAAELNTGASATRSRSAKTRRGSGAALTADTLDAPVGGALHDDWHRVDRLDDRANARVRALGNRVAVDAAPWQTRPCPP